MLLSLQVLSEISCFAHSSSFSWIPLLFLRSSSNLRNSSSVAATEQKLTNGQFMASTILITTGHWLDIVVHIMSLHVGFNRLHPKPNCFSSFHLSSVGQGWTKYLRIKFIKWNSYEVINTLYGWIDVILVIVIFFKWEAAIPVGLATSGGREVDYEIK